LTAWLFGKYSLKGKLQVEALLHYVIDEPPENADNKQAFKFPFIACEIFTCEIDVILKTLVEDEEVVYFEFSKLMSLLFLFLEPDRPHGTLLAGYFSKVVSCLLFRKTIPVMRYLQENMEVLKKLVDLIGISSIMEVC
jgi:serine/threonine-protein phosphatase 6 regulatory subunit 3